MQVVERIIDILFPQVMHHLFLLDGRRLIRPQSFNIWLAQYQIRGLRYRSRYAVATFGMKHCFLIRLAEKDKTLTCIAMTTRGVRSWRERIPIKRTPPLKLETAKANRDVLFYCQSITSKLTKVDPAARFHTARKSNSERVGQF